MDHAPSRDVDACHGLAPDTLVRSDGCSARDATCRSRLHGKKLALQSSRPARGAACFDYDDSSAWKRTGSSVGRRMRLLLPVGPSLGSTCRAQIGHHAYAPTRRLYFDSPVSRPRSNVVLLSGRCCASGTFVCACDAAVLSHS